MCPGCHNIFPQRGRESPARRPYEMRGVWRVFSSAEQVWLEQQWREGVAHEAKVVPLVWRGVRREQQPERTIP